MPRPHYNQRGFTLTELLTALAVAAIGLSLAAPGFQELTSSSRRTTSINSLVSTLHRARSEAVTRNQQVTVCPSDNGTSCVDGAAWNDGWIAFPDPDQDRQVSGDEQVLVAGPGVQRLNIDSEEFGDFIVFRPSGRIMVNNVAENSGQFTFCDDGGAGKARVAIIEASGHPRLSEVQFDGAAPNCPDAG